MTFIALADKLVEAAAIAYFQSHVFSLLDVQDESVWIAGGAVRTFIEHRNVPKNCDFDLWCKTDAVRESIESTAAAKNWTKLFENDTSSNWRTTRGKWVQVIRKHTFETPEKTLAAFDFSVCAMAVSQSRVLVHENALLDMAMKRLSIISLPFPVSSMKRALKYAAKGFSICTGELTKLIEAVQKAPAVSTGVSTSQNYPWHGLD